MPKHIKSIANKALADIRKSESRRKKKPNWAAGFATARVEGGKPSAVVRPSLTKAKSDIRKYGIEKSTSSKIAEQTEGWIWFEGGQIFIDMKRGSFSAAQKTIQEYFKHFKIGCPTIRRGEALTEDQIAANEQDDEEPSEENDDVSSSSTDNAAVPPPSADTEASPQPATSEIGEPEPAAMSETPAEEVASDPVETDLPEEDRTAAEKTATTVSGLLQKLFKRLDVQTETAADDLRRKAEGYLLEALGEEEKPELRKALLETAPCRLQVAMARQGLLPQLGATASEDNPLDYFDPDAPVAQGEVADHFFDLASRAARNLDKNIHISRTRIEDRIASTFGAATDAKGKLDSLHRLSMSILPVLQHRANLELHFGIPNASEGSHGNAPTRNKLALVNTLMTSIGEIEKCRIAHERALQKESGETLSSTEHAYFDSLSQGLSTQTNALLEQMSNDPSGSEDVAGEASSTLKEHIDNLRNFVKPRFAKLDKRDKALGKTNIVGRYLKSLSKIEAQLAAS
ncbi:hypothetical protein [Thalassococcus sp. S3]|uniref:hypothetical protein n=1 Tax=Thalassococcus sp. S3 TaxID=2017482 RepID=UPI0010242450|nr:hypothetical protein [Thalassococcus sp. S3]QBF33984.1 hypothetical protein CFI11_22650 [Thalassococcus sp. S3]